MRKNREPIIIAALHLPYYGRECPTRSISSIEDYVVNNAHVFYDNGIKTIIIQDENLVPDTATEETIAVMSAIGRRLKMEMPDLHLGIIVQAHDPHAPIAIAHACGAEFVRMKVFAGNMLKAEGLRRGLGPEASRYRTMVGANVKILVDIQDREGVVLGNVPVTMTLGWADRFGADGFIITGKSYEQTKQLLKEVAETGISKPVIVGGSVNESNILEVLELCDGAVVSSSLMTSEDRPGEGIHWDAEKIRSFCRKVYGK